MTLEGRVWTLLRKKPDFTPLSFSQRYVGEFSEDGSVIERPLGDGRRVGRLEARLRARLTAASRGGFTSARFLPPCASFDSLDR
jgi:hypothetical protein